MLAPAVPPHAAEPQGCRQVLNALPLCTVHFILPPFAQHRHTIRGWTKCEAAVVADYVTVLSQLSAKFRSRKGLVSQLPRIIYRPWTWARSFIHNALNASELDCTVIHSSSLSGLPAWRDMPVTEQTRESMTRLAFHVGHTFVCWLVTAACKCLHQILQAACWREQCTFSKRVGLLRLIECALLTHQDFNKRQAVQDTNNESHYLNIVHADS